MLLMTIKISTELTDGSGVRKYLKYTLSNLEKRMHLFILRNLEKNMKDIF